MKAVVPKRSYYMNLDIVITTYYMFSYIIIGEIAALKVASLDKRWQIQLI